MCGISFLYNKSEKKINLESIVKTMNDRIIHRGPNAEGIFTYKHVGLGHRRLSILDLSRNADQPFKYNQYVLTYNGEIYNYLELKTELINYGYTFITNTDSEIIPAAYDKWGEDCLKKLNGMWSFILLDTEKNEIFFSRDRFGIKPLYYYEDDISIIMCSEIKQLLDIKWFSKEINSTTLNNYLESNYNVNEDTFFKNVKEIRGGMKGKIKLENHTVTHQRWYNLKDKISFASTRKLSYKEIVTKTRELFLDSLRLRLRSDVKVGSCLSGGIDSSAIVSMVKANGFVNDEFTTITSTYDINEYDETYYSDLLCKEYQIINKKVYPDLKYFFKSKKLQTINYHQDQPIPSCSHINEYAVFKKAHEEKITVMLDGQGADEYFLGYGEFERQLIIDLLKKGCILKAFRLFGQFNKNKNTTNWYEFKNLINSILKNRKSLDKCGFSISKSSFQLSLEEILITSIPYQLHSEDRNSMLHSIESRLPFLDYRLVEFISSVPPEKRINKGIRKSIIRDACETLPLKIKNRTDKMGFVAPSSIFIQSIKKELPMIKKELKESGYVDKKYLIQNKSDLHLFKLVSIHQWMVAFNFIAR